MMSRPATRSISLNGASRRERGFVLVVSLIFLVIMSLVMLYSMRGSILAEQVAKNMRATEQATQAAETALRYCENEIRMGDYDSGKLLAAQIPAHWETRANWFDVAKFVEVPSDQLSETNMRQLPVLPRCMVERYPLDMTPQPGEPVEAYPDPASVGSYVVTAVGFSADYDSDPSDSDHYGKSGSEVWLQSFFIAL